MDDAVLFTSLRTIPVEVVCCIVVRAASCWGLEFASMHPARSSGSERWSCGRRCCQNTVDGKMYTGFHGAMGTTVGVASMLRPAGSVGERMVLASDRSNRRKALTPRRGWRTRAERESFQRQLLSCQHRYGRQGFYRRSSSGPWTQSRGFEVPTQIQFNTSPWFRE